MSVRLFFFSFSISKKKTITINFNVCWTVALGSFVFTFLLHLFKCNILSVWSVKQDNNEKKTKGPKKIYWFLIKNQTNKHSMLFVISE